MYKGIMRTNLMQSRLKELLNYDEKTGVFIWIKNRGPARKGNEAGCILSNGYKKIGIDGINYYGHRLAWLYMMGNFPKKALDHANRIRSDNRWVNLRECNSTQNIINSVQRKNSISGFKGVTWHKRRKKWQSRISGNNKSYYLGIFADKVEAAKIYNKKAVELHGEFAFLNKLPKGHNSK